MVLDKCEFSCDKQEFRSNTALRLASSYAILYLSCEKRPRLCAQVCTISFYPEDHIGNLVDFETSNSLLVRDILLSDLYHVESSTLGSCYLLDQALGPSIPI